jgi:hypothetical protein
MLSNDYFIFIWLKYNIIKTTHWNKRQDFIWETDIRIRIGYDSYDYTNTENSDKYQS